jgi:hypothetical protein
VAAVITVEELYPRGIQVERFAADSAISVENAQVAETRMGVDGKMVAGYVPGIKTVTIDLEANSPTAKALNEVVGAMEQNVKPYQCELVVDVPSQGTVYTFKKGVIQTAGQMPAVKKILDPTQWVFHFETMERSQTG